jgi:hypothetical protein
LGRPRALTKVTLAQALNALKQQVLKGRTYLELGKGISNADPVVLGIASTFFGLTFDGSLELSQLAVARVYDETAGAVTVQGMLELATREASSFQNCTEPELVSAIFDANAAIGGLEPVLESIKRRRDEWLAHLDQRTVGNPAALSEKAALTVSDLERAFKDTEEILLRISRLYDGSIGDLHYIGGDDYTIALDWLRRAKCACIENYEKEFGVGSWTDARPKDCSRQPYDLL